MNPAFPFLALLLAAQSLTASEEYTSVRYHGSINMVPLEPYISNESDEILAGVKAYDFNISNKTGICEFVDDKAKSVGSLDTSEWKCHFEWIGSLDELESQGTTIQGVFPESGTIDLPYEVYVYSGSSEKKVPVLSGTYQFEVTQPEAPLLENVVVDWGSEKLSGFEQFLGYPSSKLVETRFNVKPTDYDQEVHFRDTSCIVKAGGRSCVIQVNDSILGGIDDHGMFQELFNINSVIPYFNNLTETLNVEYDYRPATYAGFYVNDTLGENTKTFNSHKNTLELEPNTAAIVFDVHQRDLDNTWWSPKNTDLNVYATDPENITNYKEVLGRNRFFDIPYFSRAPRYQLAASETRNMEGQIAFIYDIEKVSDGLYEAQVDARNKYNVGVESYITEEKIISRYKPALDFFNRTTKIRERAEIYFASDLAIAAHSGWADGTHISELKINGKSVKFNSPTNDPQVVHLAQSAIDQLEVGQTYELTAIATNSKGTISEKSVSLVYAPAQYYLTSVPDDLYRKVEPIRIGVRQSSGARCNFVSSAELAHEVANSSRHACYPKWHSIPDGTAAIFNAQTPYIYGSVRSEANEVDIGLDVVYVSDSGEELTIPVTPHTIELLEPNPIDLGVAARVENNNGVVLLPEGSRDLARAHIGFSRGIVEYEVMYNDGEAYLSRSISSSREYTEGTIRITAKQPFEHDVFSENVLTVRAWYRYAPEMSAEVSNPFLLIPNETTRFILASDNVNGNTLETLNLTATLEKQYNRQWTSDPARIGEYNVYIAKNVRRDEYEAISEVKPIKDGKAEFEIDLSEGLELGNNTLFAIATLAEPSVTEFTDEIISRRLGFYLFSGEAIEGNLNTRTLQGPVPMRARMSFQAVTLHESRLIEEYIWEISEDGGTTWALDESVTNHSYSKMHEEPADYMVRVRVKNRLTGLEFQSEEVRVIAYHTPRISIEGPNTIYRGIPETYKVTSRQGDELTSEDGRFYWSFDGQEWTEGESELELELSETSRLYARFISHSADGRELDRPAEVDAMRNINVRSLAPVRINASLPNLVESGTTLLFNADVLQPITSLNYPVTIEWVDSAGNVYENMHEYEVTQADINEDNSAEFKVRAWMVGLKDETFLERTLSTRPWHYETPDIHVHVRNSHQIAPINIRLGVAHSAVFAPFVELEYDWELPDGVTVARETSQGRYIDVDFTEPGVYEIKGILRDSRGGEAVAYEYIEILEPATMEPQLDIRFSEQHLRPPLRAVARLTVQRTHPNDRIDHIVWYLNGEQQGEPRSTGYFDLEAAGVYELTGEVHTRLGQVATVTETVELVENQPPVCAPDTVETATVFRVQANCTDTDGRIIKYEWEWGEGVSNQNRPTLSFSKDSYPNLNVTFRAYDDSGDHVEHSVSW